MDFDFLVVGAGIAGASAAYELAVGTADTGAKILILERERSPGYHSTGRSAAVFVETYGHWVMRALCRASRSFFEDPPAGFAEHPVLTPRSVMHLGRKDQRPEAERLFEECRSRTRALRLIDGAEAETIQPALRPGYADCAVLEPNASDIDVHGLHNGYLRTFKSMGGSVVTDAEVLGVDRRGGRWEVATRAGAFTAGAIVNAAGAWADEVARMAGLATLGLVPRRRTALTFDAPPEMDIDDWPFLVDVDEQFYFKPDAGRVLGSPADSTPVPPSDVQPEDLDVAIAIDRIEKATVLKVERIAHKWAGLRSTFSDSLPAVGVHPDATDFFWLAGQGGNGVAASSAMARVLAALATGAPIPTDIGDMGLTATDLAPGRLRDHADR